MASRSGKPRARTTRGHSEGGRGQGPGTVGRRSAPGSGRLAGVRGVKRHEMEAGGWGRGAAGARASAALPCALVSPSPAPSRQAPPQASRLLPQAAALARAVSCGAGLCVAAPPPSVPVETWTLRELSSRRSAPSKVRAGDGAQARVRGPGSDLYLVQPCGGLRSRSAVPGVALGMGSRSRGRPQAHAPPGLHLAGGYSCRSPAALQPCSPAVSVGGRGGLLQRRRRVGGESWLLRRVRPFSSRPLRSPRPACGPAILPAALQPRSSAPEGTGQGSGYHCGEAPGGLAQGKSTLRLFVLGWGGWGLPEGSDWLPWKPGAPGRALEGPGV